MPYKVIVVDDSAFMRRIVSDLIEHESGFKVIGTAKNGREAIELIRTEKPDLITMDVEMPEMNGLEALGLIMQQHPLPVIMLSGINEQGMRETIMALELGAFDFIRKPSASTSSHDIRQVGQELRERMQAAMNAVERRAARQAELLEKTAERLKPHAQKQDAGNKDKPRSADSKAPPEPVKKAEPLRSRVVKTTEPSASKEPSKLRSSGTLTNKEDKAAPVEPLRKPPANQGIPDLASRTDKPPAVPAKRSERKVSPEKSPDRSPGKRAAPTEPMVRTGYTDLVAIGTSTGGPKALRAVLEQLPEAFPAPVIIVQHMPPNFTKSLAQRLNTLTKLNVVEAEAGMVLKAGEVYIAPGGYHMNVTTSGDGSLKIALTSEAPRNGHRPSVDVMYESLLPLRTIKRHIVLLTGMGSDGAKIMKQLYDTGVTSTIAESEETCVVYGMPRSAVELGCVNEVLPLYEIGKRLVQVVK